jgi:RNA polymerase sigma-70 factor (ECF subfamily)
MQHLKDEELMCAYQKGDMLAMNEILRRYKNPLFRFAQRLCRNKEEAEDIAQEVFLRVHQNRLRYTPSGKFSTWIFKIAHNLFLESLRKRWWQVLWPRKADNPDVPVEFASPILSAAEECERHDLAQKVKRCIQGLPFLQKEALILREYEQMSYEEIATVLNKSLGTVKTLIHRALKNLQNRLLSLAEEIKGG